MYGVKGWVKVFSYTAPRENLVRYPEWWLLRDGDRHRMRLVEARPQGQTIVAKLDTLRDRDEAAEWIGAQIAVPRSSMPEPDEGEYYWVDLIGLEVRDVAGERIGRIGQMLETGAHDVMVIERDLGDDLLIPFAVDDVVTEVCLDGGYLVVDWEWV